MSRSVIWEHFTQITDYVHTVTFLSVFSCNVFKKCRFQAASTRNAKNPRWRLIIKILYSFSWKLRSFIGTLIIKLQTLAGNKTKYIAFQEYNDL